MAITKKQRAELKLKYGGRCAYCGDPLGDKWHADHLAPVNRETRYIRGKGHVATGKLLRPENDTIANLMPACVPCNINKTDFTIEQWRKYLQRRLESLNKHSGSYKHAKRFGMLVELDTTVKFFF